MMPRHTQVVQSISQQSLQQLAVELISAHILPCGLAVNTVLRKLEAAHSTPQNEDFLLLSKTFREVGLYPFVDDVSGHYVATVVDARPWKPLLSHAVEGFDVHELVGLKIT